MRDPATVRVVPVPADFNGRRADAAEGHHVFRIQDGLLDGEHAVTIRGETIEIVYGPERVDEGALALSLTQISWRLSGRVWIRLTEGEEAADVQGP